MNIPSIFLAAFLAATAFSTNAQYITVWKTDNPGTSAPNQITIPATGTNYTIEWEEVGNPDNQGTATGTETHTLAFPSAGTYQVSITAGSGTFDRIRFANGGDCKKLLQLTQWGTTRWSSMQDAYFGCTNLTVSATDVPDLQSVTTMSAMFRGCASLSAVPGMNTWDVGEVTDMNALFYQASAFNEPIGDWNVSKVTNMRSMFLGAASFNRPIGDWKVGNVTLMGEMFQRAAAFNQPIGDWDVGKVTNMNAMFAYAAAFNQFIGDWDVSVVTSMYQMFLNAAAFNQPIGEWEVGKVANMTAMFQGATAFNQPVGDWKVNNVTNMTCMFYYAAAFNQPIDGWEVGKVTDMSIMFSYAAAFNQPVGDWNVSNVTDMSYMFQGAAAFDQSLQEWELNAVTNMTSMLSSSGMDCFNMTSTLLGWAENANTPNTIVLGASGRNYGSAAAAALATLRNDKHWTITIGQQVECVPLAVTLIRFEARNDGNRVRLEWTTASETDHDYFEVQRSADAREWLPVFLKKGAGTSTHTTRYNGKDESPLSGTSYYRLKIVNVEGTADYSDIRSVRRGTPAAYRIYPNPADRSFTLSGKLPGNLILYDLTGREVMRAAVKAEKTIVPLTHLPAGTYLVVVDGRSQGRLIKK